MVGGFFEGMRENNLHIFRALGTKKGSAHRMFPVNYYNDIKGSNQILPIFVLNLILVLVCIHSFFLDLTTYLLHAGLIAWPMAMAQKVLYRI